ncbi:unnamed protein product [Spirodela intermedia]|uniref:J domain-containing protein n=1 Tax=Spirodela intermedia TaxID=51605 RepID=A0A7I8JJR8_SPIIN|nr:unnamed protein product [Spirodela intermedia]CAA6670427.1 unnamed protein product [Spirodela intermedia]
MDEFPGLLHRDFGLRPQGKGAPMSATKTGVGSTARFGSGAGLGSSPPVEAGSSPSMPVFDKPVYDDDGDIFSGLPGMKKGFSASATVQNDVFSPPAYEDDLLAGLGGSRPGSRGSGVNGGARNVSSKASSRYDVNLLSGFGDSGDRNVSDASSNRVSPPFDDDLLASLGRGKAYTDSRRSGASSNHSPPSFEADLLAGLSGVPRHSGEEKRSQEKKSISSFDDLIPGFGGTSLPGQKSGLSESKQQSSVSSAKPTVTVAEDPFVVLESTSATTFSSPGLFTERSEHISRPSASVKSDVSSAKVDGLFDDINGFDGFMKPTASLGNNQNNRNPLETAGKGTGGETSMKASDSIYQKSVRADNSHQNLFDKPSYSSESSRSVHRNGDSNLEDVNPYDAIDDDFWVTVCEIQLITPPTSAPPPSRPPPPPSFKIKQAPSQDDGSSHGSSSRRMASDSFAPQPTESYVSQNSRNDGSKRSAVSTLDGLEEFAMGKSQAYGTEAHSGEEEVERNSAAAAMKEAMDKAEAKFKHAREVRERERDLKSFKNREAGQQVREEDDKEKERVNHEREQREREKEKEQQRLEKMREVAREQSDRAAVQRAQAEARERAAVEAKERAEKLTAERERVATEARERAASEARERAAAEARERAAAEAREKASKERASREKAAVELREKSERAAVERAAAEARSRAQRAAVERAAAEARERAAAEARERAAAVAREKQQRSESDLDSFFSMGARANSAPKERSTPAESAFDAQFQNKGNSDRNQRSSGVPSGMRRPSSTTNFIDDLSSVFNAGKSNDEFREIEGETEERRKARLEREQRTRQRTAKALAEKNERELQVQREQAERDRISDSLNMEIRRWAAGKEGNLRALLSTLQYVLWPDSGWQPVSLTDLITAASVKKVYRKATLCVHPDKVVSGTVQQKYIAEKVFDLLKEAWNKFNSEELF